MALDAPVGDGGPRAGGGPASALLAICLDTVERLDGALRAFVTVTAEVARRDAAAADSAAGEGRSLGPLHGVPVAIKDNIDTAGVRTTSGSRFFSDRTPRHDAWVVSLLRGGGAVMVGKTNLAEFAIGGTTQNPHHGACRNPWDRDLVPGGSSGGSAVAVAANMCVSALGTDTGGSVRLPAALTGVCGLRPTSGRISNRGTTPVSTNFDTVGPIARHIGDLARVFSVIDRYDARDETSERGHRDQVMAELGEGLEGIRVGVADAFFFGEADPRVAEVVMEGARVLERTGARLLDLALPGAAETQMQMGRMLLPDAASHHAERLANEPERFGEDVLRRLRIGLQTSGTDYAAAMRFRRTWVRTVAAAFERVDLILTPTVPVTAPLAAQAEMISTTEVLTRFCCAWPMAGVPALTLPCGFDAAGLPVGMQLAAPAWREGALFRAGAAYQEATDWHLAEPALAGPSLLRPVAAAAAREAETDADG